MRSGLPLNSILTRCLSLYKSYLHKQYFTSPMACNTEFTSPEPTNSTESEPQSKPIRKSREHPELDSQPKKKSKPFDETEDCQYHNENCLKFVPPYYHNATSHAKGRWFGRSILDVTSSEFTSYPREYYAKAIVNGKIKLNNKKITDFDAIIKNGDIITHLMHRHEPPILSKTIEILHMDKDLVILNKPSSIPVHPAGRYHFNTLIHLLKIEYGFNDIFTVHRLDRLTSGITIFARSSKASRRIGKLMERREVVKEYVCVVQGKFPDKIDVNEPLICVSHQIGVCRVSMCDSEEGKPSETSFECLAFNGERSLVKCMPKTGRMHQIRVHLQYIGFPIINDPIYNHPAWELPKYQKSIPPEKVDEMIALLKKEIAIQEDVNARQADKDKISGETVASKEESNTDTPPPKPTHDDDHIMKHPLKYGNIELSQKHLHAIHAKLNPNPDSMCLDCQSLKNIPQMYMYLHAMTYKSCDWEFHTKLPEWAEQFEFETKADYKDFVKIIPRD